MDYRDNWAPTAIVERVHRSKDGLYRITDAERVWDTPKGKDPTDEDEKAVLFLRGVLKGRDRRDFNPTADLVVLVLDGGGDALATGKKYVENRYGQLPEAKIEELSTPPEGDPPIGSEEGGIPSVRFKVTRGGADSLRSADKLVVVSAVESEGKVIVAEAACPWRERAIWERRLVQFVGTLSPGR